MHLKFLSLIDKKIERETTESKPLFALSNPVSSVYEIGDLYHLGRARYLLEFSTELQRLYP